MKIKPLFKKVVLCAALFWAGNTHSQIYQHTLSSGLDRDHYSIVVSQSDPDRHVLAGTEESSPGNSQIHVLEVDANGIPIWEKNYAFVNDEQAFDIAPRAGGYVLTGYADNGGNDEILIMLLDLNGNIAQQNTFDAGVPGMQSYGVHVIETTNDPIPGYLVTGFALVGQNSVDSKVGIVMKLNNLLNVQWIMTMDSPLTNANDWDMNSHGLEIPGKGYFISGSANGNGASGTAYQEAQAAMLDYSGAGIWQKSYATSHNTNNHKYVSESAIYDPNTNEIFQLGNTSWSHQFMINVFDATTGATDFSKTVFFTSTLGSNIQGFEIIESNNPNHYCIGGIHRSHSWVSDEEMTFGQTLSGSPAFMLEVDKNTQSLIWDKQYNIPSAGYSSPTDIFSAFTGQQPIIYTPNLVVAKSDQSGYVFASVRKEPGNTNFDLELLDLSNSGKNICTSEPPGFSPVNVFMDEESNTSIVNTLPNNTLGSLLQVPTNSAISTCGIPTEFCQANPDFTFNVENCKVDFTDLSSGANVSCYTWDFGDFNTATGIANPSHVYAASGTYEVCLEVCCKNPDGSLNYYTYCQFVTVDCPVEGGCGCDVDNLLVDGDFQSGGGATYPGLPVNCTCAGGTVCVTDEPRSKCLNTFWIDDLWDHTLGTSAGRYLVVDGANGIVWRETAPVTAGQDYVFSFWQIREVSDNNVGNNSTQTFDLSVDGVIVGSVSTALAAEDEWTLYCVDFTATTSNLFANIDITQTGGTGYNDYGIDDIEFGQCAKECDVPQISDYFDFQVSPNDCYLLNFEATTQATDGLCYNWYVDGSLEGTTAFFNYTFPGDGVYEVCVEVFCCDDSSTMETYCEEISINCEPDECGCEVNDLLDNGDFEDTSIPVTSGLPITCTCSAGSVCVGHEPRDKCMNSLWIDDLWDHTFGTSAGHFLIVDGANGILWSDNVTSTTVGSTYIFEFWQIREISDNATNNSTQTFDLTVNGTVIGSFNTATAPSNQWMLYCAEWVANSTSATIAIVQTSGTDFNDHGIDDIQFGKCAGTKSMISPQEPKNTAMSFELYPNPASEMITIQIDGEFDGEQAEIYGLDGKLVRQINIAERQSFKLNVSDLVSGTYLIRIGRETKRFVVSH